MGSSHQQVSCYTFNDGNNWWTIKRPNREDLAVQEPIGDGVQIVHGLTHRALNSHNEGAPVQVNPHEHHCCPEVQWKVVPGLELGLCLA